MQSLALSGSVQCPTFAFTCAPYFVGFLANRYGTGNSCLVKFCACISVITRQSTAVTLFCVCAVFVAVISACSFTCYRDGVD